MAEDDNLSLDALWHKLADTTDLSALARLVGNGIVTTPSSDMVEVVQTLSAQLGTVVTNDELAPALTALGGTELDEMRRASALLAQAVEREVLRRAALLLAAVNAPPSQA